MDDKKLFEQIYNSVLDALSDHIDEVYGQDAEVMSVRIISSNEVANEDDIVNVHYEVILESDVQMDFSSEPQPTEGPESSKL